MIFYLLQKQVLNKYLNNIRVIWNSMSMEALIISLNGEIVNLWDFVRIYKSISWFLIFYFNIFSIFNHKLKIFQLFMKL